MAVIGLGYVGLPVAMAFAKKASVIGFDINERLVAQLRQGIDPRKELPAEAFQGCDILFTSSAEAIRPARFFIICVPTPVDVHNVPDLKPLMQATHTVGKLLKPGDYVVYESTTYPGCTEEECVPVLEAESGLKACVDFKVGYSPERINPGDREHTLETVVKIVAGCDKEALEAIAAVYELVCHAGVCKVSSIKVAEAAKIIENTQRDVNIALMNELSHIFERLHINTYEVLEAAATKWNFLKFYPGLVGGHCISVDPYYLTYKAHALGYEPEIITKGRRLNDEMGFYLARRTVQLLTQMGKDPGKARVLVMGTTFKENVSDIRNSKVMDVIHELRQFSVSVEAMDPFATSEDMQQTYGLHLIDAPRPPYDAVIVAVAHEPYRALTEDYFLSITTVPALLVDVKGIYRNRIRQLAYWSF